METNIRRSKDDGEPVQDATSYRRLIGKLIYLTITRSNISYVVNRLSQFLTDPRTPHLQASHQIPQYLKSITSQCLFFFSNCIQTDPTKSLPLKVFTDVDWGSFLNTRRSITGCCVFLGNSLIS
ncbi:uncharacterized mitochondrial protein AtMg00240-like [Humulus lupulus]|uniref:uncharacterized mitochondrial protein AtMg00240-like n=1 Tax=Humulus lupulus TaxID=3486 RepID=UPI002B40A9ED|nr:uncharacterized mitochondrial protein AtMg00240-like [Humulus lupulus]